MAKNILKSHNSLMLITESPAFSTGDQFSFLYGGVIGSSFDFKTDVQPQKQLGSQSLAFKAANRHPEVQFSVNYLFNPQLLNEKLIGFNTIGGQILSDFKNKSYNFTYLIHPDQESGALSEYVSESPNLSGFEAVSIGNAYLNSYSVDYSIGQIPTVNVAFSASNIKYETLSGNSIVSPAINLSQGNASGVGNLYLTGDPNYIQSGVDINLSRPDNIEAILENLRVGGQALAGTHFIQSLSMSLEIPRANLYGLGSDYVFNRKIEFPARGSISVSSLVSGFDVGEASGFLFDENGYDFEIKFKSHKNRNFSGAFSIQDAKLENYKYSMPINGEMSFDAQFSFELTETSGFAASGNLEDISNQFWSQLEYTWMSANQFWTSI